MKSLFDLFHNDHSNNHIDDEDDPEEALRRKKEEEDTSIYLKTGLQNIIAKLESNYERQYNSTMPGTSDTPYR